MALQSITNVPMSSDVWEQSSQPTVLGGLGIQKASDVAMPAYISSVASSADIVSIIVPESLRNEKLANLSRTWQNKTGLIASPAEANCKKQAAWTKIQTAQKAESILENAEVITRSRLLAASRMESAAWLSALPVATIGNLLDDSSLRIAVALRLGAVICTEHLCICGQKVDKHGHHGLLCKKAMDDLQGTAP